MNPKALHVNYLDESISQGPIHPRRYTLTHSDQTGDMFLTIGPEYDQAAISGWYTRLMRDEVLAEFLVGDEGPELHVYCHVSGGLVIGSARWRYRVFNYHLSDVLQALRYGDAGFIQANPSFDLSPITIHFQSTRRKYNRTEDWGLVRDYKNK
jgi:hypothetical protein